MGPGHLAPPVKHSRQCGEVAGWGFLLFLFTSQVWNPHDNQFAPSGVLLTPLRVHSYKLSVLGCSKPRVQNPSHPDSGDRTVCGFASLGGLLRIASTLWKLVVTPVWLEVRTLCHAVRVTGPLPGLLLWFGLRVPAMMSLA